MHNNTQATTGSVVVQKIWKCISVHYCSSNTLTLQHAIMCILCVMCAAKKKKIYLSVVVVLLHVLPANSK